MRTYYQWCRNEIKQEFLDIGERLLSGMLRARNVRFNRETLRRVIHDVDPINTALHWNAKITRRTYSTNSQRRWKRRAQKQGHLINR